MKGKRSDIVGFLAVAGLFALAPLPVWAADGASAYFVSADAETIADGLRWAEGPAWMADGYLLFSDVPANVVYKWSRENSLETFLDPSGYDGPSPEIFREPGMNGIVPGGPGRAFAAVHGQRAIVELDLASGDKTVLADRYAGKAFNSPNDLVRASDGSIYFTDPTFGLAGMNDSPLRELEFAGVFRLAPEGVVTLIDDSLSFPNGIALSPDERTLYVSVADQKNAVWLAYDLSETGEASNRRVFYDATARIAAGARGLPDGMAVAKSGEIFATGPGGLYIFASETTPPQVLPLAANAANCTFGEDGSTLFVTAHDRVLRLRTKVTGKDF